MAKDIVTRLRKKLVMEALGDKATYLTLGDCLDAADEIESLRAKLALTEHELFRVAHERSELADAYRQLRQEYEKVRGNA